MIRYIGLLALATTLSSAIAAQHALNVRRGSSAVDAAASTSASQAHRLEQVAATTPLARVTKLRLINADTNQPIAAYDPLPAKALVDAASLPTANLNIEAVTLGSVASMLWLFNGERRTEDAPLWAYCGNNGADFYACQRLRVGMNATISATPYSAKGANGTAGQGVSIALAIVTSAAPPPVVVSFTLMNADTDTEIGPLVNDTIIDLSKTPRVNVRANVAPSASVKSVQFALNGNNVRVENGAPYALASNNGADYFAWTPPVGRHVIAGAAFGAQNAQGAVLSTASVSIVVQSSASPIAAPTSTPVAPPKGSTAAPVLAPTLAPQTDTPTTKRPSTAAPVAPPTLAPQTDNPTTKRPTLTPTRAPVEPASASPTRAPTMDRIRPQLLHVVISETVIDVSNGPVSVVVQVTAKDDCCGIGQVDVLADGGGWYRYIEHVVYQPSTNTGSNVVVYNATLNFPRNIRRGNYTVDVIVQDRVGNMVDSRMNGVGIIQVKSWEDVAPPQLLRMVANNPVQVDVSNGPAHASFQVDLEDAVAGLLNTRIEATGHGRQYYGVAELSKSYWSYWSIPNRPVVPRYNFTVNVAFPPFIKPGNYSIKLSAEDNEQNKAVFDAARLASLGFPSTIEVINRNADVTPPQLVNFATSSPRTVNASASSNGMVWPYYSMTFSDNETGAMNICMKATYDTNRTLEKCMIRCVSNRGCPHDVVNFPIKGLYTFGAFFTFNPGSWRGNCSLSVYLNDLENNKVIISSEELTARGFPGYFTVV